MRIERKNCSDTSDMCGPSRCTHSWMIASKPKLRTVFFFFCSKRGEPASSLHPYVTKALGFYACSLGIRLNLLIRMAVIRVTGKFSGPTILPWIVDPFTNYRYQPIALAFNEQFGGGTCGGEPPRRMRFGTMTLFHINRIPIVPLLSLPIYFPLYIFIYSLSVQEYHL